MVLFDWPSKRERAVRRAYEAGKRAGLEEREAQREKAITPDADIFETQVIAPGNATHGKRQFGSLADAKSWIEQGHIQEGDTAQVVHFIRVNDVVLVRDVFRFERGNWYQGPHQ